MIRRFLILALLSLSTSVLGAKDVSKGRATIQSIKAERVGDEMRVSLWIGLDSLEVQPNDAIQVTPVLTRHDMPIETYPSLLVTGKRRHIIYERSPRLQTEYPAEMERTKGSQQYYYETTIPYTDSLRFDTFNVLTDLCGCGWDVYGERQVASVPMSSLYFELPHLAYVTPEAKVVEFEESGQMMLKFIVNTVELLPYYKDNMSQLSGMVTKLERILGNEYAELTEAAITGYASPEGKYANNVMLADGRAKAIINFLQQNYNIGNAATSVETTPEDWEGLAKRVEQDENTPYRKEILELIGRRESYADIDMLERDVRRLGGGRAFNYLKDHHFPDLRRSEYRMRYKIRALTLDEARELMYTSPRMLSLNDMFRVAQTYEQGSAEFNEAFEIAVRNYPEDPVSNLNAAVTAIYREDIPAAEQYLTKALDCPEKEMATKALSMLKEHLNMK